MREFAQELVDLIIDNVAVTSNTADIGSCGRVCREWLPRSRLHLLSHLTLSNTGPSNIQSFLSLADASSMPILPFVRTLHIRIHLHSPWPSEEHMERLHNFPTLKEFRLHGLESSESQELRFLQLVHTHVPLVGAACPSLTRFELGIPTNIPLPVLADVLAGLQSLVELRLSGEGFFTGIVDCTIVSTPKGGCAGYKSVPRTDAFPPHLRTVDIVLYTGASLFFQWLLSHRETPILTSLSGRACAGDESSAPIETYLSRFGPQIKSLSFAYYIADGLGFWSFEGTRAFEERVRPYTPRLVELALFSQQPETIPATLLSLPSAYLETLTVGVYLVKGPREPDWSAIDAILAMPRFGLLRHLSFMDHKEEIITAQITSFMPQARARNILVQ